MSEHCIEAVDLVRRFGRKTAINHLDLTVTVGGIHAVVGSNGAGKSTFFRLLLGVDTPTSGSARLLDTDCRRLTPAVRGRVGYVNEEHSLPGWMAAQDLIEMQKSFYPNWNAQVFNQVVAWFDVDPKQKVAGLSRGERAGLNLSMSLAQRPDLLILDEPTLGLDVVSKQSFLEALMLAERAEQSTIIYCSHQMEEIERVADHLILLENGQLKNNSTPEAFCRRVRYWTSDTELKDWSVPGLLTSRVIDGRHHLLVADQGDDFAGLIKSRGGQNISELSVSLDRAVNAFLRANHTRPEPVLGDDRAA